MIPKCFELENKSNHTESFSERNATDIGNFVTTNVNLRYHFVLLQQQQQHQSVNLFIK